MHFHGGYPGPGPPSEEPMNTNTSSPSFTAIRPALTADSEPSRCQHRFANGKRCRLPGVDSQLGLCLRHFTLNAAANLSSQKAHDDTEDLSAELLGQPSPSASAVEVKQFLSRLLLLVTRGRISPRRASILVYITNQLLYSHTANHR